MVEDVLAAAAVVGAGAILVALWRRGRSSPEYVSLVETAEAAWEQQIDTGPAATLEVAVEGDVAVYADPTELTGLLAALFENAVVHGPADGTVRLERADDGFAVSDDGPGIPESEREQVFEFGYSTRPDHDGLGLGLVYSVCVTHDWDVEVVDSDGGGTRIVVSNVEFLTGWEGGDHPGDARDSDAETGTASFGDSGFVTGEVENQQEGTNRERTEF